MIIVFICDTINKKIKYKYLVLYFTILIFVQLKCDFNSFMHVKMPNSGPKPLKMDKIGRNI